jgi:hypothetical protein
MAPVEFPWRNAIDAMEEVGAHDSYSLSMKLSRAGLICGPSSGFNLKGLYQFLAKRKAAGTLQELTDPAGEINCVFLCCDLPYQYINEYFENLDSKYFPTIHNQVSNVQQLLSPQDNPGFRTHLTHSSFNSSMIYLRPASSLELIGTLEYIKRR